MTTTRDAIEESYLVLATVGGTLFGLRRMIRSPAASLSPFLIEALMSPVLLNYQSGVLIEFVKID